MQAVKLRYLNAIGVESWVRRSRQDAVGSQGGDAAGPSAADAGSGTDRALFDPAESVVERLADEPVAAVRSLLDAEPTTTPPALPAATASAADEVEAAPADSQHSATPASQAAVTPEFRLLLLHLEGSVLLLDETLLDPGALQVEQTQLLGDVLRTARLLVHGDATGSIELQVFYWPQVDDATLDQGWPRAREALLYHVRSRLEGGVGPVLHVTRSGDLADASGTAMVRDSMAGFGATSLELGAELLDLQAPARVRAEVWAQLCSLEAAQGETSR